MSKQNTSEQGEAKAAVLKKEKDGEHPASHYLVVEDAEKPSTWHLRVRDADGNLDHRLMGAAWAALHEGYRGQRYEGPDKEAAIAKLKKLYKQEDMEPPGKSFAVKMLSQDDEGAVVGGYLLLWGDPEHKDLQGDYFTPETQLWLENYPQAPCLFHHGLDDTVGLAAIGHRTKAVPDDIGVWVEDWIDKSNQYWKLVEPLLEAERLFYSPGSARHLVDWEEDGKLLSYPPVEDTLTPIPAQHRLRPVEQIKAAYKAAGLDLPDLDLPGIGKEASGDDGGPSCEPGDRLAVVKAKAKASALLARIRQEQE